MEGHSIPQMVYALEVLRARPPHHPVDLVALFQEQFRQIGPVLAGDPGDQCFASHGKVPVDPRPCEPQSWASQRFPSTAVYQTAVRRSRANCRVQAWMGGPGVERRGTSRQPQDDPGTRCRSREPPLEASHRTLPGGEPERLGFDSPGQRPGFGGALPTKALKGRDYAVPGVDLCRPFRATAAEPTNPPRALPWAIESRPFRPRKTALVRRMGPRRRKKRHAHVARPRPIR